MVDDQLWGAYIRAGKELNSVDGATVVSIEEGQVNRIFVNYEDPSLVFEAPLFARYNHRLLIDKPTVERQRERKGRQERRETGLHALC